MEIKKITDPAFKKYGRVVENVDFTELVNALKQTEIPTGVAYEPSVEILENTPATEAIRNVVYGEMPIQIGYCNGHNSLLNAVEYHRDSEINVAGTDAILVLGKLWDVEDDFTYDTAKMEAFLLPAGVAAELYSTTLHYAPCGVDGAGFRVGIVLPKGTNYPLKAKHGTIVNGVPTSEDALITAVNKWLISHPEGGLPEGSFIGLKGENLDVTK